MTETKYPAPKVNGTKNSSSDFEASLKPRQIEELLLIGAMICRDEPLTSIETAWRRFIERSRNEIAERNIPDLVQYVAKGVYLEGNRDLQFYSEKLKYLNASKKRIRDELEMIRERIDSLEHSLSAIEDDAQLANIDLQNALQKQQQIIQMVSTISKTLHDTALSVIRKIGG